MSALLVYSEAVGEKRYSLSTPPGKISVAEVNNSLASWCEEGRKAREKWKRPGKISALRKNLRDWVMRKLTK